MYQLLTYRDERLEGLDPIKDLLAEVFFDVGLEISVELLAGLLELL